SAAGAGRGRIRCAGRGSDRIQLGRSSSRRWARGHAPSELLEITVQVPADRGLSYALLPGVAPLVLRWQRCRARREPQEVAFEHGRHEQLAVAVVVEEHGDVVAVVTLYRALAPALADDARAHRERDIGARGTG